ncbi:MAG: FAD-binding protein [Deltaproteobacteria bacterium]|nr:FAD-binding protein [Deltaproteobacteria bacterium]
MAYPESMRPSIAEVERTRPERLRRREFSRLTLEDKEALLRRFHPDYRPEGFRSLRVGANRGQNVPHELADLLEARSLLDPDTFELNAGADHDVDVLVIGAGGAGSSAALTAHEDGARVLITTKLRWGDANTMMAQGGIQAADRPEDSLARHYLDVMGGGGFVNTPGLVRALVTDAPFVVEWLENMGVLFDKHQDGTMMEVHGGGTSIRRMHSSGDYTGMEFMRVVRDEARNRGIPCLEFNAAVELVLDDSGQCAGAVLYDLDTKEFSLVRARCTILASGGMGRLHCQGFPTTNHYGATADGVVIGYRAGVPMLFMDTVQYHPTGVAYPEQLLGQLVTEKVRGLGAHLTHCKGERFIYELETRDAVSAAIIRECSERQNGIATPTGVLGVWLDTPMIDMLRGEGTTRRALPAMVRQFARYEIDITQEPILMYPTQHYQNGGLVINELGETAIPNLFAAGEVSGGVHGRNRLMGNSLLDIFVFGRRAGRRAAERAREVRPGRLTLDHVRTYHRQLDKAGVSNHRAAPMILPDYTPASHRIRRLGGVAVG